MQLSIDSSWIVNFQTASGISLILWEGTLDKERDEVINDFFLVFPFGNDTLLWASSNSLPWTTCAKDCENNSNVKLETAV